MIFRRIGRLEIIAAEIDTNEEGVDPMKLASDQCQVVPPTESLVCFEAGTVVRGSIPPALRLVDYGPVDVRWEECVVLDNGDAWLEYWKQGFQNPIGIAVHVQ
jgi:hypothetical protein